MVAVKFDKALARQSAAKSERLERRVRELEQYCIRLSEQNKRPEMALRELAALAGEKEHTIVTRELRA